MQLVILESPFAGDVEANIAYARRALCDCLHRGESAIASHLLFTQPGVLRDADPAERKLGIAAGWAWYDAPGVAAVFYLDRGLSSGMAGAMALAAEKRTPCEFRFCDSIQAIGRADPAQRPVWRAAPFGTAREGMIAEGLQGRLGAVLNRRAPTPAAPYEAVVAGLRAAYYRTQGEAQAGAELWDVFMAANAQARASAGLVRRH